MTSPQRTGGISRYITGNGEQPSRKFCTRLISLSRSKDSHKRFLSQIFSHIASWTNRVHQPNKSRLIPLHQLSKGSRVIISYAQHQPHIRVGLLVTQSGGFTDCQENDHHHEKKVKTNSRILTSITTMASRSFGGSDYEIQINGFESRRTERLQ